MKIKMLACLGLGVAALAGGGVLSGAAGAGDDKTYTLAPKYTVGEVLKYSMKSNMKMEMKTESGESPFPGGDMVMSMGMKYKTTKIDDAGVATVVLTSSGGEMSFMGQSSPMPETPPVTMTLDKRGLSKSVSGLENAQGMGAMSQMFNFTSMPSSGFYYPDRPVKIGETWEGELPGMIGEKKIKVTGQLLSVETVGGKEVYKVKQVWTIPMDMMFGQGGPTKNADEAMMVMGGEFVSTGDVLLAADSGRINKLVSNITGAMTMEVKGEAAQQSPFGSKMTMSLGGKAELALTGIGSAKDEPEPIKPKATATSKGKTGAPAKKPAAKPAKKP